MTPLRKRFIEDLQLRNFAPKTIRIYLSAVIRFAAHFQRSPEVLGPEHVRAYQLHLIHERRVAYNSCRNRHCPKCRGTQTARWLQREAASLLPVQYFHVVFTLPEEIAALALQNPRALYGLLFQASWEALRDVAANPKRLGAEVGVLTVLNTWGQGLIPFTVVVLALV